MLSIVNSRPGACAARPGGKHILLTHSVDALSAVPVQHPPAGPLWGCLESCAITLLDADADADAGAGAGVGADINPDADAD